MSSAYENVAIESIRIYLEEAKVKGHIALDCAAMWAIKLHRAKGGMLPKIIDLW